MAKKGGGDRVGQRIFREWSGVGRLFSGASQEIIRIFFGPSCGPSSPLPASARPYFPEACDVPNHKADAVAEGMTHLRAFKTEISGNVSKE